MLLIWILTSILILRLRMDSGSMQVNSTAQRQLKRELDMQQMVEQVMKAAKNRHSIDDMKIRT